MEAHLIREQKAIERRPLELAVVERPVPGPDEILVKVAACGICRTDLHLAEGDLPQKKNPFIPGHQIVGRIASTGSDVKTFQTGERVGIAWLNRTCGVCRFCDAGRENLCDDAEFTGWTVDGGFAEYAAAPAEFTYPLPENITDTQAAPLLCAGIIGFRALRLTGIEDWEGANIGIYGFGAAGHVAIQIATARGARVCVATRDKERHQKLAEELGAAWVGDAYDRPPVKLDAGIVFAPAGEIVPYALKAVDKGGSVVLGGIHMSPVPEFEYRLIYGERIVRSVANNTRADGLEFLAEAAGAGVRTHTEQFEFESANEALIALKNDAIRGAGVLVLPR